MSKDLFMKAHDQLIEEYLESHPAASWSEAYERTSDAAYERMRDMYADMVDAARDREKYEGKS